MFQDVIETFSLLEKSPNKTIGKVSPTGEPKFNHIDFVFAKDIDVLFTLIQQILNSI